MPRAKEVTAEDDSLDSRSHGTDEEAIAPHQFQGLRKTEYDTFKKTEYESLHLSPEKSVIKVLWERVSAEIGQRSSRTMQAGIKGSLSVRKTWSPPATAYYDEYPTPRQRLPSAEEKSNAKVVWDRAGAVADHDSSADIQTGSQTIATEEDEPEHQLTESDRDMVPSIAAKESTQVVWDRVSSVINQEAVANTQDDNTSYTGSREQVAIKEEESNASLDTSNPEHQRQLEADIATSEKQQDVGTEDTISSKTPDSTSDFTPRGEQEDQESVEEYVTIYDGPNKEQLLNDSPLRAELEAATKTHTATFKTKEIPGRLTNYLEEQRVMNEEKKKSQYSPFIMDSPQMQHPIEEIQEEVKPRHILHEDVPVTKTVESLSHISDPEMSQDGGEEEEEVPCISYNAPKAVQQAVADTPVLPGTSLRVTTHSKMEALRKELEEMEAFDDDEDTCMYDEQSMSLKRLMTRAAAGARTYVMPDPVRARIDDDALIYHVPRSPEAPRRFSDKVFFRFK
ncbi:uncharacterized protein LOC126335125 isoform X1 [Schistocerca gregaria]|uniref:uncharacterized protein LOC126335125 isoform X1 n=2 Tax=Schistocerca gregaria TaxID=7010 RepID=UPI00211E3415|nr:uncharacterized protein LOC126335125 isoform X1 [Schistocerca gregaria]